MREVQEDLEERAKEVSLETAPGKGVVFKEYLEAGGAAEREDYVGHLRGGDRNFSVAGQRLAVEIRKILRHCSEQALSLSQVGPWLLQCIQLCCKPLSMADEQSPSFTPSSSAHTVSTGSVLQVWGQATSMALRDMSGESCFDKPTLLQRGEVKKSIEQQLTRFDMWEVSSPRVSFDELFQSRGVDYSGEMVRLAQPLCWQAVANSLPEGVGRLNLEDFCVAGARHYVLNFEEYLIPEEDQVVPKAPRVQVEEGSWDLLCEGLVKRGICEFTPISHLHCVKGVPLLNGLFAVGKNEFVGNLETQRLIMNLTAANSICKGLQGDMATLPTLSNLNVMVVQDGQEVLISSEDVRCFFYLFRVPRAWRKYLGFNRRVADHLLPKELKGTPCVLTSAVLPMGFCNSVAIAQHVHRNVTKWAAEQMATPSGGEGEIRRDKAFPSSSRLWRVYLDNFDEMEIVDQETAALIRGSPSPRILAMRQIYEEMSLPRHPAKAVSRQNRAEVQGALILGDVATAIPKPQKVLQYISLGLALLYCGRCTLRELQVVVGGFVYMATFRRPVLGSLNEVWRFMETFKQFPPVVRLELPDLVIKEVVRFLCLVPLCQIYFGSKLSPTVTCSDASMQGGGICSSQGVTSYGHRAAVSTIRGDVPEAHDWAQVLSVGLFDGVGALRVACDALQLPMCGHISIEQNKMSSRVVESYFPDSTFHDDILTVDEELVRSYALKYSNAAIILIGAGPPCQGVSGLNADKRGALRDQRSVLFKEVPRVVNLFRVAFPWAQVHHLMESVASMSDTDCGIMSQEVELQAWEFDALGFALCRRPRLYWCRWELAGLHLPTFTTARPSATPGRKPAGLEKLTALERERWSDDQHKFPPYQYSHRNGLVNRRGQWRLPSVAEREAIMGFPVGYTKACVPKSQQQGLDYANHRLTLLGNSWQVGVVSWLISQLGARLGICSSLTPSQVVERLTPGQGQQLQSLLLRPPLQPQRAKPLPGWESKLVKQLLGITSVKGEDLLLQGSTEPNVRFHRLRQSVPARLWRWRDVASWQWDNKTEHINVLELRAVLTSVKWRILKLKSRTQAQRAKVRRTLGPLKNLTVQPKTKARYVSARNQFYAFLEEEQLKLPRQREQLDALLAEYIEHLWISGQGRALASDTVAGLQDLDPRLKGTLAVTWRLLKTWSVNEIPNRAPPLAELALQAMVGWSIFHGHPEFALSLLVGFYSLLRTGELCDLQSSSIFMTSPTKPAIISLGYTKGGKRAGAAESVLGV
eukprot:Skav234936  [mRNA]  locus=scaffold2677:147840:152458:- [translate_table: standard]